MSFAVLIISSMCGMMGGVAGSFLWFKMRGSDPKLAPEVDALRDDLDDARGQLADMQEHTQAQLADMQERLDLAERLLTAGRASLDPKSK